MSIGNNSNASPVKTRLSGNEQTPKGWRWVDLHSVARLESGHTPSRQVNEYWAGGDIPWLSLKDIRGMKSRYVYDTIDKPTMLGIDNSSARMLPKGTVALCRTASVGNVAILGCDMATSQDFVDWVCGPDLLPEYLYEAFKASKATFTGEKQGSTHQTIYMPTVKRFKVLLPPLSEQKRIADILDKADAIRRKREDVSELTEKIVKSTFLDAFGDPVNNPHHWPLKHLGDVVAKLTDGEHLNPAFTDTGMPMIMAANVLHEGVTFEDVKYVTTEDGERFRKKCGPDRDDLLIVSRGATIGRCSLVDTDTPFCLMGSVILLKPNADVAGSTYLKWLFTHHGYYNKLFKTSGSSAQQAIYLTHIRKLPIPIPPRVLQQRFTTQVEAIRSLRRRSDQASNETSKLFNCLVQRAFKGEL